MTNQPTSIYTPTFTGNGCRSIILLTDFGCYWLLRTSTFKEAYIYSENSTKSE